MTTFSTHEILLKFVHESNRIEGIYETRGIDILAHQQLLKASPTVSAICDFAYAVAGGFLRRHPNQNVMVGNHAALQGGPVIEQHLHAILEDFHKAEPIVTHQKLLNLHPFTDGNGRSSRALWLKSMADRKLLHEVASYGFLHTYYYQSLTQADGLIRQGALI